MSKFSVSNEPTWLWLKAFKNCQIGYQDTQAWEFNPWILAGTFLVPQGSGLKARMEDYTEEEQERRIDSIWSVHTHTPHLLHLGDDDAKFHTFFSGWPRTPKGVWGLITQFLNLILKTLHCFTLILFLLRSWHYHLLGKYPPITALLQSWIPLKTGESNIFYPCILGMMITW